MNLVNNSLTSELIKLWLPSAGICVSCRTRSCGRARHATWPTWCGARWRSRWTAHCASTRRAWTSPSNTSCPPRSPWGWQDSAKSQWVTDRVTHRLSDSTVPRQESLKWWRIHDLKVSVLPESHTHVSKPKSRFLKSPSKTPDAI